MGVTKEATADVIDKYTIAVRFAVEFTKPALHSVQCMKHICHEQGKAQTERIKKEAWWDLYVIRDILGWGMFSKSHFKQQRRKNREILPTFAPKRSLLLSKLSIKTAVACFVQWEMTF